MLLLFLFLSSFHFINLNFLLLGPQSYFFLSFVLLHFYTFSIFFLYAAAPSDAIVLSDPGSRSGGAGEPVGSGEEVESAAGGDADRSDVPSEGARSARGSDSVTSLLLLGRRRGGRLNRGRHPPR